MWQSILHLYRVGRTISGEEWFLSILHVELSNPLNRGCVLLAVMEAIQLAFIYLVAITMACDSHRPLIYTITNIGKQEISKREVKINIVHSAREGAVAGINEKEDEGEGAVSQEEKVTSEDMKVALPRKEEELKIKMSAESNGIYPVLQPSDSPV